MNILYTNGVIAVREKSLLGEKLLRFAEMKADEVLHALAESGFGSGADSSDSEALCAAEEAALDEFIRLYAPTRAAKEYLLAPRDHHNAKALVKAAKLHTDGDELFAPDGLIPLEKLSACIGEGNFEELGELGKTAERALSEEELSGAEIGFLFDKALFERLSRSCGGVLRRLLAGRADRINVLTVLRSPDWESAEAFLLPGGKCKREELQAGKFKDGEIAKFYRSALAAKERGTPFVEAERALDSFEAEYFAHHRFELEGKEPFLYYVFRRRAEIANVRILLVCLNAGLSEREIKKRLRAI